MTSRAALLGAVASIALAQSADAGHFKGWYVGLDAGANSVDDAGVAPVIAPSNVIVPFGLDGGAGGGTIPAIVAFDNGWGVFATVGHAFDCWRIEGELGYRNNDGSGGVAELTELSFMLNALYDIDLLHSLSLTLGAGVGYDIATLKATVGADDEDGNFAYQGIAAFNYALDTHIDLTLTYRYFLLNDPDLTFTALSIDEDDLHKQSLTIGLRYAL